MKASDYIKKALRSESTNYDNFYKKQKINPRIEHALYGLVTEVGEIMDQLKKAKIYNTELDTVNMVEEVGDIMWYLAVLCDSLGISFEDAWKKNINKLQIRYPHKYDDLHAVKRDLQKERTSLEE